MKAIKFTQLNESYLADLTTSAQAQIYGSGVTISQIVYMSLSNSNGNMITIGVQYGG